METIIFFEICNKNKYLKYDYIRAQHNKLQSSKTKQKYRNRARNVNLICLHRAVTARLKLTLGQQLFVNTEISWPEPDYLVPAAQCSPLYLTELSEEQLRGSQAMVGRLLWRTASCTEDRRTCRKIDDLWGGCVIKLYGRWNFIVK